MLKEKLTIKRKKAVMITADFTAPTTESYQVLSQICDAFVGKSTELKQYMILLITYMI